MGIEENIGKKYFELKPIEMIELAKENIQFNYLLDAIFPRAARYYQPHFFEELGSVRYEYLKELFEYLANRN